MTSLSSRIIPLPITVSKRRLRLVPTSQSGVHTGDTDYADAEGQVHADNPVEERSFDIEVVNDSSHFSSFQVELSVRGQEVSAANRWYEVEPEVCAKCPPGDRTRFHVVIHRAPIPAVDTLLDLKAHIFSVEYDELETFADLDLKLEPRNKSLQIHLVEKHLKTLPGERVDIAALALNFQSDPADVVIKLRRMEPIWVKGMARVKGDEEPRIEQTLPGGDSQRITFYCVPPKAPLTQSKSYEFDIEISDRQHQQFSTATGIIEVLPMGMVAFSCTPKRQVIPNPQHQWRPSGMNQATVHLEFENQSNLAQQVHIEATETHGYACDIKPAPDLELGVRPDAASDTASDTASNADIKPSLPLDIRRKRPWLGWERQLLIDVAPQLIHGPSGDTIDHIHLNPSNQVVEIRVRPMVPVWLQLLVLLLSVSLLAWAWWLRPVAKHKAPVTAVQITSNTLEVVSGGRDQTLQRWSVFPFATWFTGERRLWHRNTLAQSSDLINSSSNGASGNSSNDIIQGEQPFSDSVPPTLHKAVRTIEEIPRREDTVAVGLEDGSIQLWSVNPEGDRTIISDATDRVFALTFSEDGRSLFSGHGSGTVRQWDLQSRTTRAKKSYSIQDVAIRDLAMIDQRAIFSHPLVAIVGQQNHLVLWDWVVDSAYRIPYTINPQVPLNIAPVSTLFNALTSVVVSSDGRAMITADDNGLMTVWNVEAITKCLYPSASRFYQTTLAESGEGSEQPQKDRLILVEGCGEPLQWSQWQATANGGAIRAIALAKDGHHLVSVADTGAITLWVLEGDRYQPMTESRNGIDQVKGITIDQYSDYMPQTVDVQRDDDHILIAVDAPHHRVRLYRRRKISP